MPDEGRRRPVQSLGFAATTLILVFGAVVAVLGWQILRRQLDVEMARQTALYASTLAEVVEAYARALSRGLQRRAELWSDPETAPETWRRLAELFLRENPSVLALVDADPGRPVVGTDEGHAILKSLLALVESEGVTPDADRIIGPVTASDGRPVFGIQIRTGFDEEGTTVLAAFDPAPALRELLDERALGYGIGVSVGDRQIYRREPADTTMLHDLVQTAPVALGDHITWTLSVWPAATGTAALHDQGPFVALGIGLLASSLVSLAAHYGTLAWRRERALRLANAELERTIDETRRGEGDLRQLSEELEARVEQRTAELNETILELETFNYSVSHDLRGPLGAVINFAAILREDCENRFDASANECLSRIERSAATAVSMMDALLAYSRSGRTELRKTDLDMRRLVKEVCAELAAASPQLEDAVKIGDLPGVHADESMMRLVFSNLISNSCKFAHPGEAPRVEVGGSVSGGEVSYFVRDEGTGFDMRFADKLFKVFERLHGSDEYAGHGVGLAIVARLVRRHGGRVWAQGAIGKGATFTFSVPSPGGGNGRSKNT